MAVCCGRDCTDCVALVTSLQVAPVETTYELARTRVKTNVYRINKFELPFYEELVNTRTKRHQLLLNMYAELQVSARRRWHCE